MEKSHSCASRVREVSAPSCASRVREVNDLRFQRISRALADGQHVSIQDMRFLAFYKTCILPNP